MSGAYLPSVNTYTLLYSPYLTTFIPTEVISIALGQNWKKLSL